jgi:hypothetical protein
LFWWILFGLALVQGLVSLRDGWRNHAWAYRPPVPDWPAPGEILILCPVRGRDPDLEGNAGSLLAQRQKDFRVVFVVESVQDPALEVLTPLVSKRADAEIVVAGAASNRGQKVHNLLVALERTRRNAAVLVFADADAAFPPDWLGRLVAPLANPGVGAATGYRWYLAGDGAASWVRSAWNASVAGVLGDHPRNFAWGGSTAIRTAVFDRAEVAAHWNGALSDDYALTGALGRHHLPVVFVPGCLVPSRGRIGWAGLAEFTTRQIRITRVYSPGVWRLAWVSYTLFNLTFFGLLAQAGRGGIPLTLSAILYGLAAIRADLRTRAAGRSLGPGMISAADRWFHALAPPLVSLVYQYNLIASALTRRIVWKGIAYRMVDAGHTVVESRVW